MPNKFQIYFCHLLLAVWPWCNYLACFTIICVKYKIMGAFGSRWRFKSLNTEQFVSFLRPVGGVQLRMVMNVAPHKIVNLLKTLWDFFVVTCCNIFNVWPKKLFFQCGPRMPKVWTPLANICFAFIQTENIFIKVLWKNTKVSDTITLLFLTKKITSHFLNCWYKNDPLD